MLTGALSVVPPPRLSLEASIIASVAFLSMRSKSRSNVPISRERSLKSNRWSMRSMLVLKILAPASAKRGMIGHRYMASAWQTLATKVQVSRAASGSVFS